MTHYARHYYIYNFPTQSEETLHTFLYLALFFYTFFKTEDEA